MSALLFNEQSRSFFKQLGFDGFSLLVTDKRVKVISPCGQHLLVVPGILLSSNSVSKSDVPILFGRFSTWFDSVRDDLLTYLKLHISTKQGAAPVQLPNGCTVTANSSTVLNVSSDKVSINVSVNEGELYFESTRHSYTDKPLLSSVIEALSSINLDNPLIAQAFANRVESVNANKLKSDLLSKLTKSC